MCLDFWLCLGFCLPKLYWDGTKAALNAWSCGIQYNSDWKTCGSCRGSWKCVDLTASAGSKYYCKRRTKITSLHLPDQVLVVPCSCQQVQAQHRHWLYGLFRVYSGSVPQPCTERNTSGCFIVTCSFFDSHWNSPKCRTWGQFSRYMSCSSEVIIMKLFSSKFLHLVFLFSLFHFPWLN